jgi:hypothetical protein
VNSASYQLALWEIVNETGAILDAGSGDFNSTTAAVVTQANRYLSYLTGGSSEQGIGNNGKEYNVFYLQTTGTGQNAG